MIAYLYRDVCCESSLLELQLVLWGPPPSFTGNWNNISGAREVYKILLAAANRQTDGEARDSRRKIERESERKREEKKRETKDREWNSHHTAGGAWRDIDVTTTAAASAAAAVTATRRHNIMVSSRARAPYRCPIRDRLRYYYCSRIPRLPGIYYI